MGVCVFSLPGAGGGEDGGEPAAETGFFEFAEVELFDFANWGEPIFESHSGGSDTLRGGGAGVVGEEEVEEFAVFVEDDTDISMAAGEEPVFGVAIDGVTRFEDDAEVLDGGTVVTGDGRSYFWGGEVGAGTTLFWFVVVEKEQSAVVVAPDRFKPDRAVPYGVEFDFASV